MTLGNTTVRTSLHEKHLGNLLVTIFMIDILRNIHWQTNAFYVIFGCCDSSTLVNIHEHFVWTYMAVNYGT